MYAIWTDDQPSSREICDHLKHIFVFPNHSGLRDIFGIASNNEETLCGIGSNQPRSCFWVDCFMSFTKLWTLRVVRPLANIRTHVAYHQVAVATDQDKTKHNSLTDHDHDCFHYCWLHAWLWLKRVGQSSDRVLAHGTHRISVHGSSAPALLCWLLVAPKDGLINHNVVYTRIDH